MKLHLRPPFLGGQRAPNLPIKIKVCGEPSWGVRESLFQIRVQTHERFRRLSLTYIPTNKHTQIQLHVYIYTSSFTASRVGASRPRVATPHTSIPTHQYTHTPVYPHTSIPHTSISTHRYTHTSVYPHTSIPTHQYIHTPVYPQTN